MIKRAFCFSKVQNVSIIGSGQMGAGIGFVSLVNAGYNVKLIDNSESSLSKADSYIKKLVEKSLSKGKIKIEERDKLINRLTFSKYIDDCKNSDLVIEAVNENKDLKSEIFKEISKICREDTILATNTSSISLNELSLSCFKPERLIGMHFFNPVPVLNLLEIINCEKTDKNITERVKLIGKEMGKVSVVSKDSYGFITNRILMPWINEAIIALEEGVASKEDIDTAMKLGTNVPMGPLTLADFIGLDTCLSILEIMHKGLKNDKFKPSELLKDLVNKGYYGKKSGKGFYNY